jgi:hypothetical protein
MHVVQKDPHQLRDRHGWVRVVELDGHLRGKCRPIGIAALESTYQIGRGAGDEKILLYESQSLRRTRGVIWTQYPSERLGFENFGHSAHEIAVAELLEVEVIGRRCGPEPERVDGFAAVAHHGAFEGDTDEAGRHARNRT